MKEKGFSIPEKNLRETAQKEGILRFAVGAGIEKDGKLLLVRRSVDDFLGGQYELPGGGVDKGETFEVSLRREIREEVGLVMDRIKGAFKGFDYAGNDGEMTRQFNFQVNVQDGEVILNPQEHDLHVWVGPEEINTLDPSKEIAESVADYFRNFANQK